MDAWSRICYAVGLQRKRRTAVCACLLLAFLACGGDPTGVDAAPEAGDDPVLPDSPDDEQDDPPDDDPVPPAIVSQPADTTVIEGETASFEVEASGDEPLTYQWRRDGGDISGATGAQYETPTATPSDDGAVFDVVVSNAHGSVTSESAVLQVTELVGPDPPGAVADLLVEGVELPPGAPQGLALQFAGDPVSIEWSNVPGAESYEITIREGGVAVEASVTAQSTFEWRPSTDGEYTAQVVATNGVGAGPPSDEIEIVVYDFRDFVEFLLLGSGPMALESNPGCFVGTMTGWPAGAQVSVVVGSTVEQKDLDAVQQMVDDLSSATGGVLDATVESSTDPKPLAAPGELTVAYDAAPCGLSAGGCVRFTFASTAVVESAELLIVPDPAAPRTAMRHEMGHALYGFCHHADARVALLTVMGYGAEFLGGLTPSDLRAVRAAYDAGLRAGATRADFVAAGLISP